MNAPAWPGQGPILHVVHDLYPGGGPPGYVYNLRQGYLRGQPWSTGVALAFAPPDAAAVRKNSNAPRHAFSAWWRVRAPAAAYDWYLAGRSAQVARALSRRVSDRMDWDRVAAMALHGPHWLDLAREARRRGKRVIFMSHAPAPMSAEVVESVARGPCPRAARWFDETESELLMLADQVLFPSPRAWDGCRALWPAALVAAVEKKAVYLPSGVEAPVLRRSHQAVRAALGITGRELLVAFAGRYHRHKGFDIFLATAACCPDLRFICLGAGPIPATGPANLRDLGWQQHPHDFLGAADIVLVPNRVTYFDLLPLEVMALGRVVAVSPVGGNLDLAAYSDGVRLVTANTPAAFAAFLASMRENPGCLQPWGEQNRQVYLREFALDPFVRRHIGAIALAES